MQVYQSYSPELMSLSQISTQRFLPVMRGVAIEADANWNMCNHYSYVGTEWTELSTVMKYKFQQHPLISDQCSVYFSFQFVTPWNNVFLGKFIHIFATDGPVLFALTVLFCLQEPATFPYPESHELTTSTANLCLENSF
jgi:hypothetical protein